MESNNKRERRERKKKRIYRISRKYSIPFFAVLGILTVIAFLIPLRPERSYSEKRALTKFPEFSMEALFSGDYFDDITLWFSDTFPGRELWISASNRISAFHGVTDIAFTGTNFQADEIPVVSAKEDSRTEEESSEVKEAWEETADSVLESNDESAGAQATQDESGNKNSGEDNEMAENESTASADTEGSDEADSESEETASVDGSLEMVDAPEGDIEEWGGIDAGEAADIIFGNLIQIGGSAFSYFGFSQYCADWYIEEVNYLADKVTPQGVRVIAAPIPSSVGVMVEPEYQEKLHCSEQNAVLEYLDAGMNDNVTCVNMFPNLVEHNDEYLYFRTDHHWTALAAYYGYESICEATGQTPTPLEEFEARDMGEFYGSFYGQAPMSYELEIDDVVAYYPPDDIDFQIGDGYSMWEWPLVSDMSTASIYSKYMCFIAGDNALSLAVNNDLPDGKTCVVVKDSCGNPLIPFLCQNYHKVYVLDFRAYDRMNVSAFCEEYGVDDVILAHMLGMVMDTGAPGIFSWLLR